MLRGAWGARGLRIENLVTLMLEPGALAGLLTWKPFSFASFRLVRKLLDHGCRPGLVIDVGANEGQFSRAIRGCLGPGTRILGFEPHEGAFVRLQSNFRRDPNANFRRLAIGSHGWVADFHVNEFSQASSILQLDARHLEAFPEAREVSVVPVEMASLDVALAGSTLGAPALLKIDVQGYELEVLKGATATLKKMDFVLVEVALTRLYAGAPTREEIEMLLASAGFRRFAALATLRDADGMALQADELYGRS